MKARMLLIGNAEMIRVLAGSLLKKKYKVSAVHPDYKVCEQLSDIQDLTVICGDGTKPYILEEAGARQADTVIAMTSEDADNLVICELCKKRFGVQKTVCTVENAENTSFFRRMGVDSVVCATNTITAVVEEQAFVSDLTALFPIGEGRLRIMEVCIKEGVLAAGKKIHELKLPGGVIIGCILRQERTIIPGGETRILAGDTLILIASAKQELKALQELTGR